MGCGNEISDWDDKAIQESKSGKNTAPALLIAEDLRTAKIVSARNILDYAVRNKSSDLKAILANWNDPRHKTIQELLENSLSHGQLTRSDELKLVPALKTVLDLQNNPQGLFKNPPIYRGPGANAMQHGGELLTAAAIIQKGGIRTSLGNKLNIYQTDTIGFGQKFASNYALSTRKANTIEADTLISRRGSLLGTDKYIGIDTKYSKTSSTYSAVHELDRQLNGIKNCYNSGELHEFYFVSNVKFSAPFKEMVEEHNIEVFKDRLRMDTGLKSNFGKYLTDEERNGYIPEEFEKFNFKEDMKALREASQIYGVPQTGMCEDLNYREGLI
ncbi:MAG: hypothetical protein Q8P45_03745 [Candidatus Harrisonbacteria bacterium]|nr:hypothetical protein [Candidatus Harrisonbacteria bacterium]